ncbi:unnamed protein product [Urochloa decumbens]|uniref:Uncharacterized protein n=1 Tax=Urochloa decumbens TaxID=240449 RepID=A0ABC8WE59_9POAL
MYPRAEAARPPAVRCPSPSESPAASVVPGRREQRELAAAAAAATAASGSEVHLVGEGAGRHHPDPDAGADHAVVVHPGRADGRRGGAAEEAVVEAAGGGAVVVAERAGGGVVEVADLRRVVVVAVVVVRGGAQGRRRVGRVRVGCSGGRAVVARREERDGPRGEEVLGGGVGAGARGVATPRAAAASSSPAAAAAAEPLHALEVEAVLLEVGGDVLAREAVDAHQLHYRLGHGVLDAEVGDGVDEALVELRRPDQARPLQRPGRLVAGAASAAGARGGGRAAAVHVRAACAAAAPAGASPRAGASASAPAAAVRRDVEGDGEIGRDERLGERHQLVRPGKLLLAAREPAGLLLLPHGRGGSYSPAPLLTSQGNSCSSLHSPSRRRAAAAAAPVGSTRLQQKEGKEASEEGEGRGRRGYFEVDLSPSSFPTPSLSSLLSLACVCVWAFSSPPLCCSYCC